MDQRRALLNQWLHTQLVSSQRYNGPQLALESVSGDASFRRYFRYRFPSPAGEQTVVGVDAPPDKEDSHPFVKVAQGLSAAKVNVPPLLALDLSRGFMMLGDFGDQLLLPLLNEATVDAWYGKAMAALFPVMRASFSHTPLPAYGADLLQREMELFREWFCGTHLQLALSEADHRLLSSVFSWLEQQALAQPQVTVHRDYHSRNLMVLPDDSLGIIDFQDAVCGPITYDLMSLLRDCYIAWPTSQVRAWVAQFSSHLQQEGLLDKVTDEQFWFWFNCMGAQRHLKVCGIFARLNYRDGKAGYLKDIPLTLAYLIEECDAVSDGEGLMRDFACWLREVVVPALVLKQPDAAAVINERLS